MRRGYGADDMRIDMKTILLISVLLSGCATCREHPVACTAAGAFVAASVALSFNHGGDTFTTNNQEHRQLPFVHPVGQ